jgi:flagellar biosynthesis protein FlhA
MRNRAGNEVDSEVEEPDNTKAQTAPPAIEVRLGPQLAEVYGKSQVELLDRITSLRRHYEQQYGFMLPNVRITDSDALGDLDYEIRLQGSRFAAAQIQPDRMLAIGQRKLDSSIEGIDALDPSFGLPALWIEHGSVDRARLAGFKIIDPVTVLLTHLGEVIQSELPLLVSRALVTRLLEEVRERQPGLVEELVPAVLTVSDVQRVFQNLVSEGVSIGNPDVIIEHLVDIARFQKDPAELTEILRQRMSYAICHQLRGAHADLAVLNLDPRIENQIATNIAQGASEGLIVEPRTAEILIRNLATLTDAMHREGRSPVLLCSNDLRRHLKAFTRRTIPKLSILSINEIPNRINLTSFDVVRAEA